MKLSFWRSFNLIIYQLENDELQLILIGKRKNDEVYKKLKQTI